MSGTGIIGISRHRIGVDGMGVTTLVAFHGCVLDCKYCLNPKALKWDGVWKSFTPQQLFDEVKKDELYFLATGGGITFGGGEPLIQCKFILHFRKICEDNGKDWMINIETALNVPEVFVSVLTEAVNHWIVDIKDMNPDIYKAYTGEDNEMVVNNLKLLVERKVKVTVRVPLIPDYNTEEDVKRSIAQLQEIGITDIDKFTYIKKEH